MYIYMYIVCVRYMLMKDAEGRKKEASMYIQCISTCTCIMYILYLW